MNKLSALEGNFSKIITLTLIVILSAVLSSSIENSPIYPHFENSYGLVSSCIDFISLNNTIRVNCGSATLTDIYNLLNSENNGTIGIEGISNSNNGIWLLKSNLVIGSNSSFTIDPTDTKWLRIYSDGKKANSIRIYGKMIIDSVKITSWNPKENDYFVPTKNDSTDRRGYISVMEDATGTTNITNSELSFLGYNSSLEPEHTPSNGISYYGGQGSVIKNNNIHNNNFGFYSALVGGILIENNHIHHNTYYGMDPHSGTHDMVIRNNTVHNNGKHGIICSQHCRNITIENNEVYHNTGSGISFSIDMQNSVVRNNNVYDQDVSGISVSQSSNNQIHNNIISFSKIGIKIINNSSNNNIYNNSLLAMRDYAIFVRDRNSDNNTLANNDMDASRKAIRVNNNSGTLFKSNDDKETTSYGQQYEIQKNSTLNFEKTFFQNWTSLKPDNSTDNILKIHDSGTINIKDGEGVVSTFDTDNKLVFTSKIQKLLSIITSNGTFEK